MRKNKSSKSWVIKQHRDPYFKKAKTLKFRSRSAFKLSELNQKFSFLKKKMDVIDIGSSPGGWSQVVKENIKDGKIIAIDVKEMDPIDGVIFIKSDFLSENLSGKIKSNFKAKIDLILSDMAENTTGIKNLDSIRTNNLAYEVLNFSLNIIKSDGVVVSKLFMGEDFEKVKVFAKNKFIKVNFFKPNSSRKDSKETYIHCKGLKAL